MMNAILTKVKRHGKTTVNQPRKGTFFTISSYPHSYKVQGYMNHEKINFSITSDSELWEFVDTI